MGIDRPWLEYRAFKEGTAHFWLDEGIWGHRFIEEQNPMLILLELLCVMDSVQRQGKIPFDKSTAVGDVRLSHRRNLALRFLIFNNPNIGIIARDRQLTDTRKWEDHLRDLQVRAKKIGADSEIPENFEYLRNRFDSFESYVRVIEQMRKTAIEMHSNKRWTSKFLFPFCRESLFEDLNEKNFSNDRRFFGRTGELVYLMLARSSKGEALWKDFETLFFNKDNVWKGIIEKLAPDSVREDSTGADSRIGYLPYPNAPEFDLMGEDIACLMSVPMPDFDVVPHLSRLIAFHVVNYILRTGKRISEPKGDPRVFYVLEIVGRKSDSVRRLSKNSMKSNDEITPQALSVYLETLELDTEIATTIKKNRKNDLLEILEKRISLSRSEGKPWNNIEDAGELWNTVRREAIERHEDSVEQIHHAYSRWCGLSSRRGTNAYRYAPTDNFMRTLVLCNIKERMEFRAFLDRLYERYGFIISDVHASNYIGREADKDDFDSNANRLRLILNTLGCLRSLSDGCSYVINRYGEQSVRLSEEKQVYYV